MADRSEPKRLSKIQSPPRSSSATSGSVAGASDDELAGMIRSVRLDSALSDKPGKRDEWQPQLSIQSDLSTADFDAQAISNSFAASKAMAHVPESIRLAAAGSAKTIPRHELPQRPITSDKIRERRQHLPQRPELGFNAHGETQRPRPIRHRDFETQWFSAPADNTLNDPTPGAWAWKDRVPSGWRQPKFQPSSKHEEAAAREKLRPPTLGGKSKKDQLGSVNESWGPIGQEGEKVYGMFEIERDPLSRSTSPFKEDSPRVNREDIRAAKDEAFERARQGTPYAGPHHPRQQCDTNRSGYVSSRADPASSTDRYTPQPASDLRSSHDACGPSMLSSAYKSSWSGRYDTPESRTPQTSASRDVFGPRQTFGERKQ